MWVCSSVYCVCVCVCFFVILLRRAIVFSLQLQLNIGCVPIINKICWPLIENQFISYLFLINMNLLSVVLVCCCCSFSQGNIERVWCVSCYCHFQFVVWFFTRFCMLCLNELIVTYHQYDKENKIIYFCHASNSNNKDLQYMMIKE